VRNGPENQQSPSKPIHLEVQSLYNATLRCLRILIEHVGFEEVARRLHRSPEEIQTALASPMLLPDVVALWTVCTEECESIPDRCCATVRVLIERDAVDEEMLAFLVNAATFYLDDGTSLSISIATMPSLDALLIVAEKLSNQHPQLADTLRHLATYCAGSVKTRPSHEGVDAK